MIRRPIPRLPRPALRWLGLIVVAVSTAIAYLPMRGAVGEHGNVTFGLFIGAAAITLMAWSFVLAVRLRFLERFFGGLDRTYRAHRWAGALAMVAMYLHTQAEPEMVSGIRGASQSTADAAKGLAGTGETLLYVLIILSVIRWIPYRWWRFSHKLIGIPFAFACWHFYTAEKPYANGSAWGWWFVAVMLAGLGAYVYRVVGRDMLAQGVPYRVVHAQRNDSTLEVELAPDGIRRLGQSTGQFAVVKVQRRGLREPHVFTVASSPNSEYLRFFIRDLGDWTSRLVGTDLIGTKVIVEGPYGCFRPLPGEAGRRVIWVAGGVGITPFLAAIDELPVAAPEERPTLAYCVRRADDAVAICRLRLAEEEGRIRLEMFESSAGRRFAAATSLGELAGGESLRGAHVAVCGPASLVVDVATAAHRAGAAEVETEDFDIRSGVGPDLSQTIDDLVRRSPDVTEPVTATS